MPARSLALLALLAACAAAEAGKSAATTGGSGPLTLDATFPATFGALTNAVELPDGRVAVADSRSRWFFYLDFAAGTLDTVGRQVAMTDTISQQAHAGAHGVTLDRPADAGVYKMPGWVARLRGDTIGLVDFAALRTTAWGPDKGYRGVVRLAAFGGVTPVLAYDTTGHGYKVDYRAVLGGGEPGTTFRPDSIPLLRIRMNDSLADTVAHLASPEFGEALFGEQVQQVARLFSPNDAAGVFLDGSVWVARARQNRVDVRDPRGTWTLGTARPFDPLKVTDADTARVMANLRQRGLPSQLTVVFPFAATKPAFEAAVGNPAGEVWLQRSRAAGDSVAVYDVWGRQGTWQRAVTLPPHSTLVGFGNGVVYLSVRAENDARRLARYRQ